MICEVKNDHSDKTSLSEMDSGALEKVFTDKIGGLGVRLRDLKPYILEAWARLENGEMLCGCKSKKKFCEKVFRRNLRTVQRMLVEGKIEKKDHWKDKRRLLDPVERYERLYHFVEKNYENDFDSLEQDLKMILNAQQKFADIAKRTELKMRNNENDDTQTRGN
jgi:hypothetical protein